MSNDQPDQSATTGSGGYTPATPALVVRTGRVRSVDLYEVTDSELDLLEKGTPADLQLNFAIFLLSLAFSSILALATATFVRSAVQTTFIVVSVVGVLLGAFLLISWLRNRTSSRQVCRVIRKRLPQTPGLFAERESMSAPAAAADEPGTVT